MVGTKSEVHSICKFFSHFHLAGCNGGRKNEIFVKFVQHIDFRVLHRFLFPRMTKLNFIKFHSSVLFILKTIFIHCHPILLPSRIKKISRDAVAVKSFLLDN